MDFSVSSIKLLESYMFISLFNSQKSCILFNYKFTVVSFRNHCFRFNIKVYRYRIIESQFRNFSKKKNFRRLMRFWYSAVPLQYTSRYNTDLDITLSCYESKMFIPWNCTKELQEKLHRFGYNTVMMWLPNIFTMESILQRN